LRWFCKLEVKWGWQFTIGFRCGKSSNLKCVLAGLPQSYAHGPEVKGDASPRQDALAMVEACEYDRAVLAKPEHGDSLQLRRGLDSNWVNWSLDRSAQSQP
jgi:hypothetical protein